SRRRHTEFSLGGGSEATGSCLKRAPASRARSARRLAAAASALHSPHAGRARRREPPVSALHARHAERGRPPRARGHGERDSLPWLAVGAHLRLALRRLPRGVGAPCAPLPASATLSH